MAQSTIDRYSDIESYTTLLLGRCSRSMSAALAQRWGRIPPRERRALHQFFGIGRSFHSLSKVPRRILQDRAIAHDAMENSYEKWSLHDLIARIHELEAQAQRASVDVDGSTSASPDGSLQHHFSEGKPTKAPGKVFNASRYSTRLIALKFAYLGQKYNGFEHHANNDTPLPTIEEELWKAMVKTRLINPETQEGASGDFRRIDRQVQKRWRRTGADVNWDGCEYSKCGRTDRGVSAFGQVIGIRVRSNRPLPQQAPPDAPATVTGDEVRGSNLSIIDFVSEEPDVHKEDQKPFHDSSDELPYIQLLNRVLPPDIRIYAWCPDPPPDFSARFSCKERRYKYFFTNPAFAPVPGAPGVYQDQAKKTQMREGWLDIPKMRQACQTLIGLHDFRNFCKIDASKQLTNFERRIFHADIEEVAPFSVPSFLDHIALQPSTVSPQQPKTYAFVLHGSAFLWHQVRSIVAILFLIGQGLESPSLVSQLLDVTTNPTRPKYEMASDAPLVLWDCIFPHAHEVQTSDVRETGYEDRLNWIFVGDKGGTDPKSFAKGKGGRPSTMGKGKWGRGGVIDDVWEMWHRHKTDETLSALLLDRIAAQGRSSLDAMVEEEQKESSARVAIANSGPRIFDGGDFGRAKGNYVPILQRERQESVEVVNERYRSRKGIQTQIRPKEEDADE